MYAFSMTVFSMVSLVTLPGNICLSNTLNLFVLKNLRNMPKRKGLSMKVNKEKIRYILQFFFDENENANQTSEMVQTTLTRYSEDTESGEKTRKKVKVTEEKLKKTETQNSPKPIKALKTKEKSGETDKKPINKTDTDFSTINFLCDKNSSDGKAWNCKISSWNVVSLKSITKKNGMDFVKHELPDIMCFQETKCSETKAPEEAKLKGYNRYFVSGEKEGYAGVALYSKNKPLKVDYGLGNKEFDTEGRVITAEYEKFFLVTAYVPNSGRGLVTLPKRMKWDPVFRSYLSKLDAEKPVILCGDLNVAHQEIDLKNPATNTRTAGFTQEERDGFTALLKEGFVDTFRKLYPDRTGAYTFWNYIGNARSRNAGWRIDYFVVSERLMPAVCDSVIRSEVYGSDHCPITLFLSV